jgi:oleate hydratase
MRRHHSEVPLRQPSKIQAWLIGGGIASLAAAVHLIRDAKVPGSKIHVLDVHRGSGGGMETTGNPTTGYMVYTGRQPYFHNGCMGELLSLVPHPMDSDKTLLETLREDMTGRRPQGGPSTRFIAPTTHGPEKVSTKSIPMALHHRLGLMKIMLESEKALGKGRIRDFLNEEFFETGFWFLWSTT